jgi:hypothetical protein
VLRVVLTIAGAITGFALGAIASGRRRQQIADQAVDAAHERLRGRRCEALGLDVDAVFSYGAVDISVKHCVVWILVKGADSQRIPAWLTLTDDGRVPAGKTVDDALAQWLGELHAEVVGDFARAGWGARPTPAIGIESSERVSASGQFFYFK